MHSVIPTFVCSGEGVRRRLLRRVAELVWRHARTARKSLLGYGRKDHVHQGKRRNQAEADPVCIRAVAGSQCWSRLRAAKGYVHHARRPIRNELFIRDDATIDKMGVRKHRMQQFVLMLLAARSDRRRQREHGREHWNEKR
jgi:hypothetical protein